MPFRTVMSGKSVIGIGVDITEICNRRCPTCFAQHTPRHMDLDVFYRIVDQAQDAGFSELYVLGGEPTLHPQIFDCLRYVERKFNLVILVTNMDRLADAGLCRTLEALGVVIAGQRHTLAMDENAQRIDHQLTGGNHLATSDFAWRNVTAIFPPDRVCVQCCITAPVVESGSIFDVFRWCRGQGYEPVMEFTKEGMGFRRGCALDVSPEDMLRVLTEFRRIDREEFGLPGAELLSPQAYGKTCHMQETSIHFRVDGTAIPCVGHPALSYGNINVNSMFEILNYPLRRRISNPREWIYGYCCDECPHFDLCTGGCRGSSFDITGCYRSSFYYCPHIPRERLSIADMIPPTCTGCPLEGNLTCRPRRR